MKLVVCSVCGNKTGSAGKFCSNCGHLYLKLKLRNYLGEIVRYDKIKISRFISLILRHKPEVIGITIDSNGWANTKDLIAGINSKYSLTMKQLIDIVNTDDKQRYSFNSDKSKIRANQGHSISVDLQLEPVKPPKFLYHGTAIKYKDSIFNNGIVSKSRQYVHLSCDIETATNVGMRHGSPIILIIDSEKMFNDGYKFYISENKVWLTEFVPSKYINSYTFN